MEQIKINEQITIQKMNDHYCLVKNKKDDKLVELCFYSVADALAYSAERNYV
ncbi:hypothetical protein [Lederbergia citrea]|uniref:hypothetical protein n=1 Tax=Lederbergia citrea TaxID=2833581 RepID=UPI001BC9A16F|nr:hypothetical protein [Lederbergia citrea]MBS4179575.1 hypothetical protein [Lederbergia citrea]